MPFQRVLDMAHSRAAELPNIAGTGLEALRSLHLSRRIASAKCAQARESIYLPELS